MYFCKKNIKTVLVIIILAVSNFANALPSSPMISGWVSCEGRGIEGVVVTDGIHFTQTDTKGKYHLILSEDAPFVYLSTPSGYLSQRQGSIPHFYQSIQLNKSEG